MPTIALVNAALAGFFAFAALHYGIQWWLSRSERILLVFALQSFVYAVFSWAMGNGLGATTVEEAQTALDRVITIGVLAHVLVLQFHALLGKRRDHTFRAAVAGVLLALVIYNQWVPVRGTVLELRAVPLPAGATMMLAIRTPPSAALVLLYVCVLAICSYGFFVARTLWKLHRAAAVLAAVGGAAVLLGALVGFLVDFAHLRAPYMGAAPHAIFTACMAVLLAREYSARGLRVAATLDRIPALAWSASGKGSAWYANRRWVEYTGQTIQATLAQGWDGVFHPSDRPIVQKGLASMAANAIAVEFEARMRRADGVYRWFLTRAEPLRDRGGETLAWFGTHVDIEERKRAEFHLEWRLRLSEVSTTLASAPVGELPASIDAMLPGLGELLDADRISITWLPKKEVELPPPEHAWMRPGVRAALPSLTSMPATVELIRAGGTVRLPSAGSSPEQRQDLLSSGVRAAIGLPLQIGGEVLATLGVSWFTRDVEVTDEVEHRLRLASELLSNALARERAAEQLQRSASALDAAQRELAHVTRVTTLGALTASIAHEINQPLSAIVTNATAGTNWLDRSDPDISRARETLLCIALDGKRAADVLARIRAMLKRSTLPALPCDVTAVVEDVLPLLRSELARDRIVLVARLEDALPPVLGDAVELQQVLLNLVLNAAESSREVAPERRQVVVRASAAERDVVVAVEDNGVGLGGVDTARVFETFYTTKTTGLGMGLSISRAIIERHGGRLWFESKGAQGATFQFSLPSVA